jgi:hypothetical protein
LIRYTAEKAVQKVEFKPWSRFQQNEADHDKDAMDCTGMAPFKLCAFRLVGLFYGAQLA